MVGVQVIETFGAHRYQMWPLLSNGRFAGMLSSSLRVCFSVTKHLHSFSFACTYRWFLACWQGQVVWP